VYQSKKRRLPSDLNPFAEVGLRGRPLGLETNYSSLSPLRCLLFVILLQYTVHTYFIFALRASNEALLSGGNAEQEWGFGQIVAVISLAGNLLALFDGIQGVLLIFLLFRLIITY
jgi:hypothetical protein